MINSTLLLPTLIEISTPRPVLCLSLGLRYLSGTYSWRYGNSRGVALMSIPLDELLINGLAQAGVSGRFAVYDRNNTIVFASDPTLIGQSLLNLENRS